MSNTPTFAPQTERVRIKMVAHQQVQAKAADVFPLLCPIREYEWYPDWNLDIIYTGSGTTEEGSITRIPDSISLLNNAEVWVTTRYEPPYRSESVSVSPHQVIQFKSTLTEDEQGHTTIRWEATYTALDEEGDRRLRAFDQEGWKDIVENRMSEGFHRVLLEGKVYGYSPTKVD